MSLYQKPGETAYTVDLSKMKHKVRLRVARARGRAPAPPFHRSLCGQTTRFYGPVLSTLPESIGDWVSEYEQSIAFEMKPEQPYLFSLASDWERSHSSSSWCQLVKSVMLRHAGVAAPPKLMRAVFCTSLRSAEGVDEELLKSCAQYETDT